MKKKYYVEIYEYEVGDESNPRFEFDDFEKAIAYVREANFQGHELELMCFYDYEDSNDTTI